LPPERPSFVGCSVGFAALAATVGAFVGILLGLALGRPVAECEPLAQTGLVLGAVSGSFAALFYAGLPYGLCRVCLGRRAQVREHAGG
jgi:hypothetical protein